MELSLMFSCLLIVLLEFYLSVFQMMNFDPGFTRQPKERVWGKENERKGRGWRVEGGEW